MFLRITIVAWVFLLNVAVGSHGQNVTLIRDNIDVPDMDEVQKWTNDYTDTTFLSLNPRMSFDKFFYLGPLTNEESKSGVRDWLKFREDSVPPGYEIRYAKLNFEREYFELTYLLGTKKLSSDLSNISYDDDGFTTIENRPYAVFLESVLKKNGLSKKDFIDFFEPETHLITRAQILRMERFAASLAAAIKARISPKILSHNVNNYRKLWKIEKENSFDRYFMATDAFGAAFILAKKNGRVQVLGFPKGLE